MRTVLAITLCALALPAWAKTDCGPDEKFVVTLGKDSGNCAPMSDLDKEQRAVDEAKAASEPSKSEDARATAKAKADKTDQMQVDIDALKAEIEALKGKK